MTKPTQWHVRSAKTQIRVYAKWVARNPRFLHADSRDSVLTKTADTQADLKLHWQHVVSFGGSIILKMLENTTTEVPVFTLCNRTY